MILISLFYIMWTNAVWAIGFVPCVRLSGLRCRFYIANSTLQLSVVVDDEYSCLVSAAAAIRLPPSIGDCLGHFPERSRACFTLPFQSADDIISARGWTEYPRPKLLKQNNISVEIVISAAIVKYLQIFLKFFPFIRSIPWNGEVHFRLLTDGVYAVVKSCD